MSGAHIDLTNQIALITGASRGIGRAIAIALAKAGAAVVVSSRKIEACEAVVAEIAAFGGRAIALACNASDPAQLALLVEQTQIKLGPISILVCNAATNAHYGPMTALDNQAFEKIIATNVGGNIKLVNLVAPGM